MAGRVVAISACACSSPLDTLTSTTGDGTPQRGSLSFHCERVIRTAAWGFLEDDEPREYRKRRDHQQLVIGDVCDDLRLLRDVERRAWRVGRGHIGT